MERSLNVKRRLRLPFVRYSFRATTKIFTSMIAILIFSQVAVQGNNEIDRYGCDFDTFTASSPSGEVLFVENS